MKVGYLRVSTEEQRPDRQVDGLTDHCDELHVEALSAACPRRPVYEAVVAGLMPGDTLVVWDLDRAFRSTMDALLEVERLHARGVRLQVVQFPIDPSTAEGRLFYTIVAAFAEFERQIIRRRTVEGLAAARRRGARLGRPPKLTAEQLARMRDELARGGATIAALAAEAGVAPWTLSRAFRRMDNA